MRLNKKKKKRKKVHNFVVLNHRETLGTLYNLLAC